MARESIKWGKEDKKAVLYMENRFLSSLNLKTQQARFEQNPYLKQ